MPTYQPTPEFLAGHGALTKDQKELFRVAVRKFIADLKAKHGFRKGLRVKGIKGADGLYEMTWAPDGRAVFTYGAEQIPGEPHIIWLAVGTHAVLP